MRCLALSTMAVLITLSAACATGGRDAHDIANDLEGTLSTGSVDRVLHDVDLQKSSVTLSVDRGDGMTFGANDQEALESTLRSAVSDYVGDTVHVTQQVVEESGPNAQQLTLTLALQHGEDTRYVPVALELVRDGRRMLIARVRVMASGR